MQNVVRYNAAPKSTGTAQSGVSFEVRPLVSPDKRFLRLEITQNVSQVASVTKTARLDVSSGKEFEVEVPSLYKCSVTGSVQFADGGCCFLMPCAFRPSNKDKLLVLVAQPRIWIEDEEKIRNDGKKPVPEFEWSDEAPEEEKPAPVKRLPYNDKTRQILQAIVTDVLTNPQIKKLRASFGTERDKTFTLVDEEKRGWPKEFQPYGHDYTMIKVKQDPFVDQNRILGISLRKFDLKSDDKKNAPIEVSLANAGGSANGGHLGSATVLYRPKRVGNHWTVEYVDYYYDGL
jgi:hypothetical protein